MSKMKAKTKAMRQTYLAHFDECPLSAKFYEDAQAAEVTSHAMARGILFHDFAEIIQGERAGLSDAEIDTIIDELLTSRSDLVLPMRDHDDLRDLCRRWYARFEPAGAGSKTEVKLEVQLAGQRITGRLDLLTIEDAWARVRDYKTNRGLPTAEWVRGSFQVRCYAYMVFVNYPAVTTVEVENEYVRYGAKRSATIERDQFENLEVTLIDIIEKVGEARKSDDWIAVPGTHCNRCANTAGCPISAELRGEGAITDELDATTAASDLVAIEARRKDIIAGLKSWVDENGPVDGGQTRYDYSYSEGERLDKKPKIALKERLGEADIDPAEYWKPTQTTRFIPRKLTEEELEGGDDA